MASFLKNAKHTYDVESKLHYIAIEYTQWNDDAFEYQTFTEYLQTKPVGAWTELTSLRKHLSYDKFLDTMVEQTLEVRRRKASLGVESVDSPTMSVKLWLLNCMKILDPTFVPPLINTKATWQRELVDWMLTDTIHDLIERCRNERRLDKFYHVTQIMKVESQV